VYCRKCCSITFRGRPFCASLSFNTYQRSAPFKGISLTPLFAQHSSHINHPSAASLPSTFLSLNTYYGSVPFKDIFSTPLFSQYSSHHNQSSKTSLFVDVPLIEHILRINASRQLRRHRFHQVLATMSKLEEGVQQCAEIAYESKTLSRCPSCNSEVVLGTVMSHTKHRV